MLIQGFGQGLGLTPLVGTIVSRVQSRDAGAAAGIVATSFQVGNVLGIAVVGLVFFLFLGVQSTVSAHAVQYVAAISGTLPFIAALALIPYGLVFLLPRAEAEGTDVLLERLPQQATVIAYALYFLTGGHVSDHFIDELRNRTIQRKTARGEAAPHDLASYLVYNYTEAGEDQEWMKFITREALTVGNGPVPHEEERRQVIAGFVDEIRQRQTEGYIQADLHPASLRLMVFALNTCPRAFPQITRMLTGYAPTDPAFEVEWTHFLRQLGQRLAGTNEESMAPIYDRTAT